MGAHASSSGHQEHAGSAARVTSSRRDRAPSLPRDRRDDILSTVRIETTRCAAISALVIPRTTSWATSGLPLVSPDGLSRVLGSGPAGP